MKTLFTILTMFLFSSCLNSNQSEQKEDNVNSKKQSLKNTKPCDYIKDYEQAGNRTIDTVRTGKRLIDPIDDFSNFQKTDFGFVKRESRLFKKARTHRRCNGKFIDVEYYQEFTDRIELNSYKEYNDRYFATKKRVNFWWVNSDGYLIIPINEADPKTFKPFENICGGTDKDGMYYGCPNYGVYKLNIPRNSKFEFVAKENNYWNSPNHYVIVNNKVFDIKYELEKGYFCELDKTVSAQEILNRKN